MTTLASIALTFVLSTIIGSRLVQNWQQRNWLQQQWLLRSQQQLSEFKKVIDEMMTLGNARCYRSRKLLKNIGTSDLERLSEVKKEYDEAVTGWNDKFTFFSVQLTVYSRYENAERLERTIQQRFFELSIKLERLLQVEGQADKSKSGLEEEFDVLTGHLFTIFRDLTNELVRRQEETYLGRKVWFEKNTLDTFSTWYLFKALFKKDNPPQAIIGSIEEFGTPSVFRL